MKESVLQSAPPPRAAPFFQPKLRVNTPNDAFEREADQVADAVVRLPAGGGSVQPSLRVGNGLQRQCAHCEEEEKRVQRKDGSEAPEATPAVEATLSQAGQPLDADTRRWAEGALGYDFSKVQIHADGSAGRSAASIGARAYTSGTSIVFGAGEFSPHTEGGRHLLAHELTHVVQQGGSERAIQRVPTADELTQFDELARQIRAHAAYRALPAGARAQVEDILRIARRRDNATYFATNLLRLLDTPDAPAQDSQPDVPADAGQPQSVEEANRDETSTSMYDERSRLFNTEGHLAQDVEERASADPARRWTSRRGQEGIRYDVDATDPSNIVVRLRVYLRTRSRTRPRGMNQADFDRRREQDRADVAMVRELEDGIEKAASAPGYTVDVQFVDRPGPNVFTVDVDMSRWADSGNFVGEAHGLGHEVHHLLGLDDRYNYIEAHAQNANMTMPNRIYWFRQEMNHRRTARDADSIMGGGSGVLTDDIAAVSGLPEATIVAARQRIADLIAQRRQQALFRVQLAYLRVNSVHPSLAGAERRQALAVGQNTLKNTLTPDELDSVGTYLSRMMAVLTSGEIRLGPEIAQCGQWAGYVLNGRVPIHLCRRWLTSTPEEQIRTLVHESAHAVGIGEPTGETYEPVFDCSPRNADLQNVADAWGHFVHCLSGQTPDSAAVLNATP